MSASYLSRRMNHIDTSQIRRMFDLAAKLDSPINLSIGQPHFDTPDSVVEAARKALREKKTAYSQTQGILPLRERLSQKFQEVNGFSASAENILVTSGVASVLQLLYLTTVDPDDEVLLVEPSFLIYRGLSSFFGARMRTIPEDFSASDLENLKFDRLKLILFSSPSNPTGRILSEDQVRALGNLADRTGALLCSDEIYEIFDYDGKFKSAAAIYPNAVTMMGFSKSYSMTGMRLAAVSGPEALIRAMTTLQQYTIVCAPTPNQWAGIAALDTDMTDYVADYRKRRDFMVNELKDHYRFGPPDGAFYLFAEVPEDALKFVQRGIDEHQLLVVPGSIFTDRGNWIRISYAANDETLERGV
ncbi:MAG: aminotransferase class I/II-fold pyridoxal phosphate-dependent enzyme, partial [Leptospiraceae bacterium]|nr:aminotransferase class I/II-fold pyridoxal phosphate-dependent enzyme [Leptospiraceae bacterium]